MICFVRSINETKKLRNFTIMDFSALIYLFSFKKLFDHIVENVLNVFVVFNFVEKFLNSGFLFLV